MSWIKEKSLLFVLSAVEKEEKRVKCIRCEEEIHEECATKVGEDNYCQPCL